MPYPVINPFLDSYLKEVWIKSQQKFGGPLFMKTKKTKCYIDTRVSTAMQVDGYSLDAQKEKLKRYADYEEMKIVGEYSDEGHSGKRN